MIVTLTGFMGCGKSSTGRALARLMNLPVIDLDQRIEQVSGRRITEIFEAEGEEGFRAIELDTLRSVIAEAPESGLILSLGGGTVTVPESRKLVLEKTRCVYLHSSLNKIKENIGEKVDSRPLFRNQEKIAQLYYDRLPVYRMVPCHINMDNLTPNQAAERIRRLIFKNI